MPYFSLVDGHCYVVNGKHIDRDLCEIRDEIKKDPEYKELADCIKQAGFEISIQVDYEIDWLGIYFGKTINDDNHSYQSKIITFDKNKEDAGVFEKAVAIYDSRIEAILNRFNLAFKKEVGLVFNQWD